MIDGVSGPDTDGLKFQIGDLVDVMGAKGVVDRVYGTGSWLYPAYCMDVLLDTGRRIMLTPDGRFYPECTESCTKKIGRAKTRIMKWQWVFHDRRTGKNKLSIKHYSEDEAEASFGTKCERVEFTKIVVEI